MLRKYQEECIRVCLKKWESGLRRQVVSLPVGSGKTVIFAHLLQRLREGLTVNRIDRRVNKALVLAHRNELLFQAKRQIEHCCAPYLSVSLDRQITLSSNSGSNTLAPESEVVVASIQTLGRSVADRLTRYHPDTFDCIVIDEAHHAAADSYMRILEHFRAFDDDSKVLVWGCSATLRRHDQKPLGKIFQEITFVKSMQEMITEGWLCNFRLVCVDTTTDISDIRSYSGDFLLAQLSHRINSDYRNELVVATYQQMVISQSYSSTLVFAVDIEHVLAMVAAFRRKDVLAVGIHSQLPLYERNAILDAFRKGTIPVLVNCAILTEGVDIPRVDSILLARPTKSSVLLQQMIGRGLRLYSDKKDCLIVDFVDILQRQSSLATVPTLLGLPHRFDFRDKDALSIIRQTEKIQDSLQLMELNSSDDLHQLITTCEDSDDIEVLFRSFTKPMNPETLDADVDILRGLSALAWVRCSHQTIVLSMADSKSLIVEKVAEKEYVCKLRYPLRWLKKSENEMEVPDYEIPKAHRTLFQSEQFSWIVQQADEWVKQNVFGWKKDILFRSASWRSKPASSKQIQVLKRFGVIQLSTFDIEVHSNVASDLQKNPNRILKGTAADLITRYMNGAISKSRLQQKRRQEKVKLLDMISKMNRHSLD